MQYKGMPLEQALAMVKKSRDIHPNNGFLAKLIILDEELQENK